MTRLTTLLEDALPAAAGSDRPVAPVSLALDYGATGMWIANLVYGAINAALMLAWLWRGKWLERRSAA